MIETFTPFLALAGFILGIAFLVLFLNLRQTTVTKSPRIIITSVLTIVVIVIVITGILFSESLMPSNTSPIEKIIVGDAKFGIYEGNTLTGFTTLNNIAWGTMTPDSTASKTFYVVNEGTVPFTLSFNASDFKPDGVGDYLIFSTDYHNTILYPTDRFAISLSLYVNNTIWESKVRYTNFEFTITFTATSLG